MTEFYYVFHYNAYDGMDYRGEYAKDELKAMLVGGKDNRGIGYEKINIHNSIIIKGQELSLEELGRIRQG